MPAMTSLLVLDDPPATLRNGDVQLTAVYSLDDALDWPDAVDCVYLTAAAIETHGYGCIEGLRMVRPETPIVVECPSKSVDTALARGAASYVRTDADDDPLRRVRAVVQSLATPDTRSAAAASATATAGPQLGTTPEPSNTQPRLTAALDVLPDMLYLLDTDGFIIDWNARVPEQTGYTERELRSMHAVNVIAQEDRTQLIETIERTIEAGHSITDLTISTKDGETIPYEFHTTCLYGDDGELLGLCGVGHDITEQEANREQLDRQIDRLEAFAGVVSHDLRNPLNVAQGHAQLLAEQLDSEYDSLDRIEYALDRIGTIIDDVLALTREGATVETTTSVRLHDLVARVRESVDLDGTTLDTGADTTFECDPDRTLRLLENLVRNSMEHGDGDGVRIEIGALPDGGFYITDDGPGIPEEDRNDVLTFGYTTSDDGTGLGLAIVQEIATAHGWTVELAESEWGGTRVEVRL